MLRLNMIEPAEPLVLSNEGGLRRLYAARPRHAIAPCLHAMLADLSGFLMPPPCTGRAGVQAILSRLAGRRSR